MSINELRTPYFVLDKAILLNELQSLKAAIASFWPNTIIAYSVKTNSLPYLAKLLCDNGVFAEVVSEDEFDMVKLCGYQSGQIVCNGPVKSREFVFRLLSEHVIVNLDSHAELEYVKEFAVSDPTAVIKVGLRVNLDIEKYFPGESKAGEQGSRFGFSVENGDLENAMLQLNKFSNVKIVGLHMHVSTSTRKVEIYQWLTREFLHLVRQYHLTSIEYFDIGGGFWGGISDKPTWRDYLQAIANILKDEREISENLTLVMEPGVSLLAGAFSYYMKVIDVKTTNRARFVVMDGSRIHIDPLFHKKSYYYEMVMGDDDERRVFPIQNLVGFTCLEYDNLMTLVNVPELKVGDVLKCNKLGAYTMTLSPLFISYFPPVFLRDSDKTLKCIRERWTAENFVQSSVL